MGNPLGDEKIRRRHRRSPVQFSLVEILASRISANKENRIICERGGWGSGSMAWSRTIFLRRWDETILSSWITSFSGSTSGRSNGRRRWRYRGHIRLGTRDLSRRFPFLFHFTPEFSVCRNASRKVSVAKYPQGRSWKEIGPVSESLL